MNFKTVSVLLVDDDRADVKAIQRAFVKEKIANPITVAKHGLEALSILRGQDGHPKLPKPYIILLDLNMPQMNGLEFLEAVRADDELRPSVVFVLTTSDQDRDRTAAYDQSIAGYMLKSAVGKGFVNLTTMLESYWKIVELPV